MIGKILGALSIVGGFFFIFLFPSWKQYEWEPFTKLAIMLGIFLILLGIYLLMS